MDGNTHPSREESRTSHTSKLSWLFNKGVKGEEYGEFCQLFAEALRGQAKEEVKPTHGDAEPEGGHKPPVREETSGQTADRALWAGLEWFVNTAEEIDRFEALGFGINFLTNSINAAENAKGGHSPASAHSNEHAKQWIEFINMARDANSSIYTTYALIERMENKLSQIRQRCNKVLSLKHARKARISGGGSAPESPELGYQHPEETPSSVATARSDRADADTLNEIWDEKMKKLRATVSSNFRKYLDSVVGELRAAHPNASYQQVVEAIVHERPSHSDSATEDEPAEEPGGTDQEDDDEGDVLEQLKNYYEARNMAEEKPESYVARIADLNKRLIPKYVKIATKLPIYYEAYFNALVCSNVQDGTFQLVPNSARKETPRDGKDSARDSHRDREPKEARDEDCTGHRAWLHRIGVAKTLLRTNLTLVEVVRCAFGNARKTAAFTQGSLGDLFGGHGGHQPRELREGADRKDDKDEDEEALNSIYHCEGNLREVANAEVDKLVLQHMPTFEWTPAPSPTATFGGTPRLIKTHHKNHHEYQWRDADPTRTMDGEEYVEFNRLEERIWTGRLNRFTKANERNVRNALLRRTQAPTRSLEFDSSNTLARDNAPFRVLLDYNNYIPIRYIYNPGGSDSGDREAGKDADGNDWIIRLFNNQTNILKMSTVEVEVERDAFPGLRLFNNHEINCLVVPIHAGNFRDHESFANFAKMANARVDLIYPEYLEQVARAADARGGFGGTPGEFFVTYHTNLSVGNWDRINAVFHLVCCDTGPEDDAGPVEYAEDTEVILAHMKRMQPVLNGLGAILRACIRHRVHTLHLPAALKCCYKLGQHGGGAFQHEFRPSPALHQGGGGAGLAGREVLECNGDYVRCLAVVSHLASLLNKQRCSVRNFNLVFPQHLRQTLLPKTAAAIFATRVNTF